jgi:hypothetical protein
MKESLERSLEDAGNGIMTCDDEGVVREDDCGGVTKIIA